MRTPIALLTGAALLLPAAVLTTPAEAASPKNPEITNCSTTRYGVQVRIKVRDEGRSGMNVRLSHRDAYGNFEQPRVKSTRTSMSHEGAPVPPDEYGREIGGGAYREQVGSDHSFRTGPRWYITVVHTTFTLRSGKRIHLSCQLP